MLNLKKIDSSIFNETPRKRGRPRKHPISVNPPQDQQEHKTETIESGSWVFNHLWMRAHRPAGQSIKAENGVVYQLAICGFPWNVEVKIAFPTTNKCEICLVNRK